MIKKFLKFVRRHSKVIFIVYLVLLVLVLIFKFPSPLFHNLVDYFKNGTKLYTEQPHVKPFETISIYVSNAHAVNDWFFKNLACNILMFVPFGLLLPLFATKRRVWHILWAGVSAAGLIEVVQLITSFGIFDIDDIILNTVGVLIGFLIYKLLYRKL